MTCRANLRHGRRLYFPPPHKEGMLWIFSHYTPIIHMDGKFIHIYIYICNETDYINTLIFSKKVAISENCNTLHFSLLVLPHVRIKTKISSLVKLRTAGPSGTAVEGVGLRPLACWYCGFEFRLENGCMSARSFVCCQSLLLANHPSGGVLPIVVCLSMILKTRQRGSPGRLELKHHKIKP